MAYAERLGLWGAGTSFADFKTFADTLEKRGVGALELLALELKSSGAYVSRGLAWQRCEFERWTCDLNKEASDAYDEAAAWWRGADAASLLSKRNETKRAPRARRPAARPRPRHHADAAPRRGGGHGAPALLGRAAPLLPRGPDGGQGAVRGRARQGGRGRRQVRRRRPPVDRRGGAAGRHGRGPRQGRRRGAGARGRGALVGARVRAAALSGTTGAGAPGGDRRRGRAEDPDDGPGPALRGARRALEGRAARGGRETGRAHPRARRAARRDPPAPRRLAGAAVAFR